MITLLSPAKSLDFERDLPAHAPTEPRFEQETDRLVRSAARLTKAKLKAIMPVSDALIDLNYRRFRAFDAAPERAALFAFTGDVYRGFEAENADEAALAFAQDHVRILSGLYGLLRPLDRIKPYRLEMGTRWAPRHRSLVAFWGDKLAATLAEELDPEDRPVVVNCASQEYFAAIGPGLAKRKIRVIDIEFVQEGPDGPRFISFEAKRARGMMARFICENRHDDPAALTGFDSDGYRFDAANSEENRLRFVRA